MKCLPKEAPISVPYPERSCLMRTELQVFCGEGIRRNRMDRLDFEASQELLKGRDDVTSELSDDSYGDN